MQNVESISYFGVTFSKYGCLNELCNTEFEMSRNALNMCFYEHNSIQHTPQLQNTAYIGHFFGFVKYITNLSAISRSILQHQLHCYAYAQEVRDNMDDVFNGDNLSMTS